MDELFGASMTYIMLVVLTIFLAIMVVVGILAWNNRVILRLGLRNIPRRRAQSVLIVVGSMLSAVVIAAAFGTGDTISHSIRQDAITELGNIDEILTSTRDTSNFGQLSPPYFPEARFDQLEQDLATFDLVDGAVPHIAEAVPAFSVTTSLSEGQMLVTAFDPDHLAGFTPLTLVSGEEVSVRSLPQDRIYLNEEAAKQLETQTGHQIILFTGRQEAIFEVEGVVRPGGMAGRSTDPVALLSLDRGQELFERPGQINVISISNLGGVQDGANLSEDVTEYLRVLFADVEVVEELRVLLGRPAVLAALEKQRDTLSGSIKDHMNTLTNEIPKSEVSQDLIRVISDTDVADEILAAILRADLPTGEREELLQTTDTLLIDLAEIRVFEAKRIILEIADAAGSGITSLFVVFGLFSIMVGVLLIFLIFVMLAAARRTDMGMVRAVGAKRSHLVQMFVFEGTAYDLVAATIGTILGLLLSYGIVALFNYIISRIDLSFSFTYHVEPRSIVVAFCLGMIIVFVTAAVSATRVSRMNIAEAVRGVPETIVLGGESSFLQRLSLLPISAGRPVVFLGQGVYSLAKRRYSRGFLRIGGSVLWVLVFPAWMVDTGIALFRFSWPYLRRGWLTLLLGGLLYYQGVATWNQEAPFAIGMSLMILGFGLMLRLLVTRNPALTEVFGLLVLVAGLLLTPHGIVEGHAITIAIGIVLVVAGLSMVAPLISNNVPRRAEVIDRHAFTFIGVLILAFWLLPVGTEEAFAGHLEGDIEMFFVSGVFMVAAAVWTVMYNADLLLRALTVLTSRVGKLRPVLVTAVAYPMSAKFRTGLTLAMFSLVIFTMTVMSLLTDSFSNTFKDIDRVSGEWDIHGAVSFTSPIDDIGVRIEADPTLSLNDFDAIGGYVTAPVEVRQIGVEDQLWESYDLQASDDGYLDASRYSFKMVAPEYRGPRDFVWQALRRDPTLAVIDAGATQGADEGPADAGSFSLQGVSIEDDRLEAPIPIRVREPLSGQQLDYTIIAVLDSVAEATGIITSKAGIDEAFGIAVPLTTYRFRLADGVDAREVSNNLEAAFLANGMQTDVLEDVIADVIAFFKSFYNLLTGYMGLGLIVGIAALGVVTMRAVVERRQQIGVLRALGYRQGMIQLSFLLESSFVALLGVAIGVALGFVISHNLVDEFQTELSGMRFTVPWIQITGIVIITYLFAMLTTYFPARQAARILPAEALRYE